jgi:hypothetical protein
MRAVISFMTASSRCSIPHFTLRKEEIKRLMARQPSEMAKDSSRNTEILPGRLSRTVEFSHELSAPFFLRHAGMNVLSLR